GRRPGGDRGGVRTRFRAVRGVQGGVAAPRSAAEGDKLRIPPGSWDAPKERATRGKLERPALLAELGPQGGLDLGRRPVHVLLRLADEHLRQLAEVLDRYLRREVPARVVLEVGGQ